MTATQPEGLDMTLTIEQARHIAAQCWCEPETSGIEMDARLAEAFARALLSASKPAVALTNADLSDLYSFAKGEPRPEWIDHAREFISARAASPAAPAQSSEPKTGPILIRCECVDDAEATIWRWRTSWGGWTYHKELPAGWRDLPSIEAYRISSDAAPQPSQTAVALGDERAAFEQAFQLIFEAYNAPRDRWAHDDGYILFLRGKVTTAFGLLQKVRAAFPQPVAQPVEQARALTMDEGELDEFDRTVSDFEDDGETSTDYNLLMDWAQRGLLECTHFEVTKAGQEILAAARPASGETE